MLQRTSTILIARGMQSIIEPRTFHRGCFSTDPIRNLRHFCVVILVVL